MSTGAAGGDGMNMKTMLQRLNVLESKRGTKRPRIILHNTEDGPTIRDQNVRRACAQHPNDRIIVISAWGLGAKHHQPS
jgi:hypothetical protein